MRILIAPDKYAGTLTAPEAAEAIARGWARRAPQVEADLCPMADGGPGFVDVLHANRGGQLVATTTTGPDGERVPATILLADDTAWIESAQAVGIALTAAEKRAPMTATSAGLGELLRSGIELGARRIVVGVGGTATNDGGAGLLAALGATAEGAVLDAGPAGLAGLADPDARVDLTSARAAVDGVELVVATDVETQLLGIVGATKTFGPQKGLDDAQQLQVDGWLQRFAELTDRKLATAPGAGAGGGIGFALQLLGARRESGVELVADAVGLAARAARADLVVTGEGAFDFSSRAGKVPYGVAAVAAAALRPCIALAGQVLVGGREMRALGIEAAYSVSELVGAERSVAEPYAALSELAERVARSWVLD
ncbi:glycerate kinase [Nocardioides daejeonensis]|uniref:glycerate kinase family protein n=1 Tax=Nocardioides daejeonensis TaxID=1046556 RepID=UPI000D741027|nr:glycerate kinase [Nocardioides daejeonensis]